MSVPPFGEMSEWVQRLLDDQIEPEEMERLQEAMRKDPEARRYYLDSMFACAVMRRRRPWAGEMSESDLMRTLSGKRNETPSNHLVRYLRSMAAVLVMGVLVLASVTLFRHKDRGVVVGTLTDVYEAQWEGLHPRPGDPLHAGPYDLHEGAAEMKLGQGTRLLLEAPCQVELNSAGEVTLTCGSLAAVSPDAKGFRVRTPTALVTDLGTEFGVIAHADGSTEADVFKGRIRIALDPNKTDRPTSLIVTEGSAAVVDKSGRTIQGGLAVQADHFLLLLPSLSQPPGPPNRLNVADLVGGGNGRGTGTPDQGIDLRTGLALKGPVASAGQAQQNEFRPTPQLRGVDGVFIPNGTSGQVVISSTGLLFPQCPRTTGGYYGGPINTGKFFDGAANKIYPARLNGVSFGTPAHPALTLHPNAGITFDLDQIRQANPNIRIARFTAICGIPKDSPQPRYDFMEVWVLLDGDVRFHLHYPIDRNAVEKVDVPIPPQARFLTLATTCPGLGSFSWMLFGDPFLAVAD
jgi:ferric-dicitrate binding protein FerR (iron transport regulator)